MRLPFKNALEALPEPSGAGAAGGYFGPGNSGTGQPATSPGYDFYNELILNLRYLATQAGVALPEPGDPYDETKLKAAIDNLIADAVPSSSLHGQCRLVLDGADLRLLPYNGNRLMIDGVSRAIPSAGVALAVTGLDADTTYYIYAEMDGEDVALIASATGHARDATTGVEVMAADTSRTLVGMARTVAGPAWVDTAAQRGVLSWFSRRSLSLAGADTAGATTAANAAVELASSARVSWLSWAGDALLLGLGGYALNNSAGHSCLGGVSIDNGDVSEGTIYQQTSAGANQNQSIGAQQSVTLAEGWHTARVMGWVSAGTGQWFSKLRGLTRG